MGGGSEGLRQSSSGGCEKTQTLKKMNEQGERLSKSWKLLLLVQEGIYLDIFSVAACAICLELVSCFASGKCCCLSL